MVSHFKETWEIATAWSLLKPKYTTNSSSSSQETEGRPEWVIFKRAGLRDPTRETKHPQGYALRTEGTGRERLLPCPKVSCRRRKLAKANLCHAMA